VRLYLRLHGFTAREADRMARVAIERVGMSDAAQRRVGGYSKGMKQRIKLAQAIAHEPRVLVLDEPLNGLDPLARSETLELFRSFAAEGRHVVISSHILHRGRRPRRARGARPRRLRGRRGRRRRRARGAREERPIQVLVRCDRPARLAARAFEDDHVVEARVDPRRPRPRGAHPRRGRASTACSPAWPRRARSRSRRCCPPTTTCSRVYQYLIGAAAPGSA